MDKRGMNKRKRNSETVRKREKGGRKKREGRDVMKRD